MQRPWDLFNKFHNAESVDETVGSAVSCMNIDAIPINLHVKFVCLLYMQYAHAI